VEKPKADTRLASFLEHDVPGIVHRHKQQGSETAHARPMFSDIGVFMQGVLEDLHFIFPNCQDHKEVLIHTLKNSGPKRPGEHKGDTE